MPDLRAGEVPRPSNDHGHKFSSTWVQIAIIAMNSASEASAAASWIRVLNMGSLPGASNANASGRGSGGDLRREPGLIICSPFPVDIDRAGGLRRLSGSFRSGSTSLILMTAAHCGQHELVAVREGGDEISKCM